MEDWVQVLNGKEVLKNAWISGPTRVCRLGAPGDVPWNRGKGATSLVGEVPEAFPPAMVVLQTDCGSVMRTCEGSIGEVGSSLFGWEKIEVS